MRYTIWFAILAFGCSQSGEIAALKASLRTSEETIVAASSATVTKTDEAIVILKENTAALSAIKTKVESLEGSLLETRQTVGTLEASLIVPKSESGKEVITSDVDPAPVVNASSGAGPGRLASDGTRLRWNVAGNWNPTILETSAHLAREHGIDTNGMTHQQMADIHADLHDGKQVAMKAKPTVMVNRGSSCPDGVCPTNTRTRKGLFGWRR